MVDVSDTKGGAVLISIPPCGQLQPPEPGLEEEWEIMNDPARDNVNTKTANLLKCSCPYCFSRHQQTLKRKKKIVMDL